MKNILVSMLILGNLLTQPVQQVKQLFVGKVLILKNTVKETSAGTECYAIDLPKNKRVQIYSNDSNLNIYLMYDESVTCTPHYLTFDKEGNTYEFIIR